MLPHDHPQAPKYWMNETGGKLVPAIERYLEGKTAEPDDVRLIRAYLMQWIDSPVWDAGDLRALHELRRNVRVISSRLEIDWWLEAALELGIDPL